jgi:hypothetical protein
MSKNIIPVIDCTLAPDLLEGWPMASAVRGSATAQALLQDLAGEWMLEAADLDGLGYTIDFSNRVMTLDTGGVSKSALARSGHALAVLTFNTFKALRSVWQMIRRYDARARYRPDLWLLLGRIAEADVVTMALRMAYELRMEGDDSVWRYAVSDTYSDMALVYAGQIARYPFFKSDSQGLTLMFAAWFGQEHRLSRADFETLEDMDAMLEDLTLQGSGTLSEGAVKCLTIDPLLGGSYLKGFAADLAGDPAFRHIQNPLVEAHFLQVMGDIGAVRAGSVAVRDKKLAMRLFPDMLVTV